jgi:hypothetical protein
MLRLERLKELRRVDPSTYEVFAEITGWVLRGGRQWICAKPERFAAIAALHGLKLPVLQIAELQDEVNPCYADRLAEGMGIGWTSVEIKVENPGLNLPGALRALPRPLAVGEPKDEHLLADTKKVSVGSKRYKPLEPVVLRQEIRANCIGRRRARQRT